MLGAGIPLSITVTHLWQAWLPAGVCQWGCVAWAWMGVLGGGAFQARAQQLPSL